MGMRVLPRETEVEHDEPIGALLRKARSGGGSRDVRHDAPTDNVDGAVVEREEPRVAWTPIVPCHRQLGQLRIELRISWIVVRETQCPPRMRDGVESGGVDDASGEARQLRISQQDQAESIYNR